MNMTQIGIVKQRKQTSRLRGPVVSALNWRPADQGSIPGRSMCQFFSNFIPERREEERRR